MTAWTEGRMEFVCTVPTQDGGRGQRWPGEVMVRSHGMCISLAPILGSEHGKPYRLGHEK